MRNSTYLALTALVLASCGGTETDNPLVDFKRTGCKKLGDTALTLASDTTSGEPLPVDTEHDGLFCFDYEHDKDTKLLDLRIYNYPSACGSEFATASASSNESLLTLYLQRASCEVTRCGSCNYDLSFQVADVSLLGGHMVQLIEVGCEGTALEREPETWVLEAGEQLETGTRTFCRTLGEPAACQSDDDCRAELEQCGEDGTCEPILPF